MWADVIIEYVTGFLFGLLIFQSLFMRKMMGGTYLENLRRSVLPEFISMNCMMAGMAPVMIYLMMSRDMRAMQPSEPLFWVVMSPGIFAGALVAYPVNVSMVSRALKHGLMTVRKPPAEPAQHNHAQNKSKPELERKRAMDSGHEMGESHGSGHQMRPEVTRLQLIAVTFFQSCFCWLARRSPRLFLSTLERPRGGPRHHATG